jgi:alpha-L-rhamnosidase
MWERWNSMLPDGSINPGEMTSFNHYAFGGVADWMHQTIGGVSSQEPGYRLLRFAPMPGGGVTSAACSLHTPYGRAACEWSFHDGRMTMEVEVPPNSSAEVVRPGADEDHLRVRAGRHRWTYVVPESVAASWVVSAS